VFGAADWDTGVRADAKVVDAGDVEVHSADAAAAVAGDPAATARLGRAGVVAVRANWVVFEVRETVDGWQLETNPGTPDVGGLAMTAGVRATQLAAERRARSGGEFPRSRPGPRPAPVARHRGGPADVDLGL
jgi:hypothetical protein